MQLEMMSGYSASKGVPAPKLAVLGSGLLLLLGGLSILTGIQPIIGATLLVIFFVPVTLIMHDFWNVEDPQMKMAQRTNFVKNTGLMASALMFVAIPTPWPLSLGGSPRRLHFLRATLHRTGRRHSNEGLSAMQAKKDAEASVGATALKSSLTCRLHRREG